MCACVCVCVCVRERERESVCVCVRERERECVCVCKYHPLASGIIQNKMPLMLSVKKIMLKNTV